MVLTQSKSKSISKQKQKQRQTVIVNIDTKKTRSKRQPRQAPRKPKEGKNDNISNPLYYPSVIHAVQQPPPHTMQPQAIKDAISEAVRNITHASSKDQYVEQLQHSNDLERKQEVKAEHKEAKVEQETLQAEALPLQTVIDLPVPDLQQPVPIANVEAIPIVAEQAPRQPTPLEKPIENENQIVQYTGKARETGKAPESVRPYLKPINLQNIPPFNPFQGTGNPLNNPFVELEKKTLREKMLQAAEERMKNQLAVIPEPPQPFGPELPPEPEPQPKQRKPKITIPQRLSEYNKETILKISKDSGLQLSQAERSQSKQLLIENVSNRLNPKLINWDSYPKLKRK